VACAIGAVAWGVATSMAQSEKPPDPLGSGPQTEQAVSSPTQSLVKGAGEQQELQQFTAGTTATLLKAPVSGLFPGAAMRGSGVKNPAANDPGSAERGMRYYTMFNCVGCHAPNGGGGMGLSLSNSYFQYGSDPANIYLSIVQGRPNGMPAWGASLPDEVVWDLVSYIGQISKDPNPQWGTTISADSPTIEQVPAEFQTTTTPWSYTQPFSHGQKPEGRNGGK
jgi:cytochrome c oxidase cbb3-type subunit 3